VGRHSTVIIRGGEYAKAQAFKLETAKEDLGLRDMTVAYIEDPEAREGLKMTLTSRVRRSTKIGTNIRMVTRTMIRTMIRTIHMTVRKNGRDPTETGLDKLELGSFFVLDGH